MATGPPILEVTSLDVDMDAREDPGSVPGLFSSVGHVLSGGRCAQAPSANSIGPFRRCGCLAALRAASMPPRRSLRGSLLDQATVPSQFGHPEDGKPLPHSGCNHCHPGGENPGPCADATGILGIHFLDDLRRESCLACYSLNFQDGPTSGGGLSPVELRRCEIGGG
ncbi:hypothetical protein BKA70DRAFT_1259361 [Coprinopsis sp. MPI-PUGE-AT-0042]|nr:hypothetical protein BKA70DRAFT_1259361 [Coprinopsis sp. MPI-PUGE-AT-0042]